MRIPPNPQAPAEPSFEKELAIGVLVVGLLIVIGFGLAHYKKQRWMEFVAKNECKVVGKMRGDVAPTVGFDAKGTPIVGTVIESDKTGWKCNDGVTYWR